MKKNTSGVGEREFSRLSSFLHVFSDETRLRILFALLDRNMCVMHISEAVGASQSAVSHQLAILRAQNIVRAQRTGKSIVYSVADAHISALLALALTHIREEEPCT